MASGAVAPFAGAWIETSDPRVIGALPQRRPLRGGVDRNACQSPATCTTRVAPFAGAWIETQRRGRRHDAASIVAPFAGAWIETS